MFDSRTIIIFISLGIFALINLFYTSYVEDKAIKLERELQGIRRVLQHLECKRKEKDNDSM